jgi:hypothetical protein
VTRILEMLGYQEMPISIVEQNGTIGPLHEIQAWLEFSHSETTYCISTQCGWAQASGTKDLGPFLLNSHEFISADCDLSMTLSNRAEPRWTPICILI